MRICILRHPATVHCRRWAVAFASREHTVQVAYFEGDLDTWEPLPPFPDLEEAGVTVEMLPIRRTGSVLARKVERQLVKLPFLNPYNAVRVAALRGFLERMQPDVLHSLGLDYYGYWGARSGFRAHLATALGSDIAEPGMGRAQRRRLAVACGASCVHLHDNLGRQRLAELGCDPRRIHLHQWGVDTDSFNPRLRSERLRGQLLGDGELLVTCVRNLRPLYDLPTLLRAAPAVLAKLPQTRFLLVGEGPQRRELAALAGELGIEEQIQFAGGVDYSMVAQLLACSDAVVDTLHGRLGGGGLGMALLEAMASAVPPVIAAGPWADGVVVEGKTGYQFRGGDANDLARKLLALLRNPKRQTLGQRCREMVLQCFDWAQSVTEIETLYGELARSE